MKYSEALENLKKNGYLVKEHKDYAEVETTTDYLGGKLNSVSGVVRNEKGNAVITVFETHISPLVWILILLVSLFSLLVGGLIAIVWWLSWKGEERKKFETLVGSPLP